MGRTRRVRSLLFASPRDHRAATRSRMNAKIHSATASASVGSDKLACAALGVERAKVLKGMLERLESVSAKELMAACALPIREP